MKNIAIILTFAALFLISFSCSRPDAEKKYDNVMLYYISGYNNLSNNIKYNLQSLCEGSIPTKGSNNAIVLFAHFTDGKPYSTPNPPCLINLYKDQNHVVMDTLSVYPSNTVDPDPDTMRSVLLTVQKTFKSDHYGMVFSSHGSGWLPSCYYDGGTPAVAPKSVGCQFNGSSSTRYEMELTEFAGAVPFKLDYIIFDACLMGGIEVAYELKDVCDNLIISPTEIFNEGMYYGTMAASLLHENPDYQGICKDYFDHSAYGATISWIDCSRLEPVATAMKNIISNHRESIAAIDASKVQRFYTGNHPWFYDMRDIAVKGGALTDELEQLDEALDGAKGGCVKYSNYTPEFGEGTSFYIHIESYCGLSMYLPKEKYRELDGPYKTLAWNKAVGLVE